MEKSSVICSKKFCASQNISYIDRNLRPKACNFIKKETLAQMFSCEFCEISKNTFFTEHVWATASVLIRLRQQLLLKIFIKKETLVQVFSCEFYEIFKSNFFHGTPPAAASEIRKINFERNLSVMYTKTNFIMHVLSYREKQGKTNCEIFGFILH